MTHSQILRQKIRLAQPAMVEALKVFWSHPRLGDAIPEYFLRLHATIRASVPLMETALERSRQLGDSDVVAPGLVSYFEKHIPEERHHDEWLLDDLEVLGFSRGEVFERIPPPSEAALVGTQYYWIHHVHPVALMGYIAVIEGNPPSVGHVESIIRRTGRPRDAFRTYLKHAHLDPHHRDDLNRALDELPLTPWHASLIGISAFHTIKLITDSILEFNESLDRRIAA